MTLLVFLSGTAGTGFIPADLALPSYIGCFFFFLWLRLLLSRWSVDEGRSVPSRHMFLQHPSRVGHSMLSDLGREAGVGELRRRRRTHDRWLFVLLLVVADVDVILGRLLALCGRSRLSVNSLPLARRLVHAWRRSRAPCDLLSVPTSRSRMHRSMIRRNGFIAPSLVTPPRLQVRYLLLN